MVDFHEPNVPFAIKPRPHEIGHRKYISEDLGWCTGDSWHYCGIMSEFASYINYYANGEELLIHFFDSEAIQIPSVIG
jgi:hypothetical protein